MDQLMKKHFLAAAWKYGPKRMYLAVVVFVVGLTAVASLFRPFRGNHRPWRAWIWSGRGWGTLALLLAGCLLVLGGQEKPGRALFEQALQKKVQAELLSYLPDPLDLIVEVQGVDPFSDQPDSPSLRLRVITEEGLEFSSEIPRSQIKDPPPYFANPPGQRFLVWQSVVDGTTSETNRFAAARINSLEDWRRVRRVEADLITRIPEGTPIPESLAIYLCRSEASLAQPSLKIFKGDDVSAKVSRHDGVSVVRYRDESCVAKRMAHWEEAAVQDSLWPILAGFLGAGGLLLAAGVGLLLLERGLPTKPVDKIEAARPTELALPRTAKDPWPPLWFSLVLQAAVLMVAQGHMAYFRLAPEGTELGHRAFTLQHDDYLPHNLASEVSWDSFVKGLTRLRTFVFPLVANGVRSLTPSFVAWPFCELAMRILAVFTFYLGLRSVRVSGWLALAVSSALLYSCFRWDADHRHIIFIDPMAECFPVLTLGMLLVVVGRPRSVLAWCGLALSLFLTYQGRPAYLFLVGLVPLLGVLLTGLLWDRTSWLRRRLHVGLGLVAASVLPYLGWCTLRWVLVGHFGLVSFGGIAGVCISGHFLSEAVIPDLPDHLRPLARAVLRDLNQLPDWQSSLDEEGRFIPKIVDDAELFASRSIQLATLISSEAGEGKEDWVVVNRKLSEMNKALIKARPWSYVSWLKTAAKIGVARMVKGDPLLKPLAPNGFFRASAKYMMPQVDEKSRK
jgi:hypothetical protein